MSTRTIVYLLTILFIAIFWTSFAYIMITADDPVQQVPNDIYIETSK